MGHALTLVTLNSWTKSAWCCHEAKRERALEPRSNKNAWQAMDLTWWGVAMVKFTEFDQQFTNLRSNDPIIDGHVLFVGVCSIELVGKLWFIAMASMALCIPICINLAEQTRET